MKLIFVVVSLYLCMVESAPPLSDILLPLLQSEEVNPEARPEKKLLKVVHFDSAEQESPWLDKHLLEITPLRSPNPYPPVAFVVGTPKHKKKSHKETTKKHDNSKNKKHSKKSKKPKSKQAKKHKNLKKQAKETKDHDNKEIDDRFGLYAAAAYPSYQGHPVIPVIYPDVPQSHIHINPYVSESSEEYHKHSRVKKKPQSHRRYHSNYDFDKVRSVSESSEYSHDHYHALHHKPRKNRVKQRINKRKNKHDENTSMISSSEEPVEDKAYNVKHQSNKQKKKHNNNMNVKGSKENKKQNKHSKNTSGTLKSEETVEERIDSSESNNNHELHSNIKKNAHSRDTKRKDHLKRDKNINSSDYSGSEENESKKEHRKPHDNSPNSKSEEIVGNKNHTRKTSVSEEFETKTSLESEQSDDDHKTQNKKSLEKESDSVSFEEDVNISKEKKDLNNHETNEFHNITDEHKHTNKANKIDKNIERHEHIKFVYPHGQPHYKVNTKDDSNEKPNSVEHVHFILDESSNDSKDLSKQVGIDPSSDENNSDDGHQSVKNKRAQLNLKQDQIRDNHIIDHDPKSDLINHQSKDLESDIDDTSALTNSLQTKTELELPPTFFPPAWLQNIQSEEFNRYLNSEEKLQAEYSKNLENLLPHSFGQSYSDTAMNEIIKKIQELDDEHTGVDKKTVNTRDVTNKQTAPDQKPSHVTETNYNDDWLNKIDEIINMLRDERYGRITGDPNIDGIFVTKHNPQTGKEDEPKPNSIFITKIVHTLDDGHDNHDKQKIQHIYEIGNQPKQNKILEHNDQIQSQENNTIEESENKTLSSEDKPEDSVTSTENNIHITLPIDIIDHRLPIDHRPYHNHLLDNELIYEDIPHRHSLDDIIHNYDHYMDNLYFPEVFKYDEPNEKVITDNLSWISNSSKESEDNDLPNTDTEELVSKHDKHMENDGNSTVEEKLPETINDTFVFDGKVNHIYILEEENKTKSDNISNNHLHIVNGKQEDVSENSDSVTSWLSLESNENQSRELSYSKEHNNINSDINLLQRRKAVKNVNDNKDNPDTSKGSEILTVHINDIHNNETNPSTRHRIEIIHNHNDAGHSSAEIISEIIEDIENIADNIEQDVKNVLKNCEATTKKSNEMNPTHKTYNLSFLFNKR